MINPDFLYNSLGLSLYRHYVPPYENAVRITGY